MNSDYCSKELKQSDRVYFSATEVYKDIRVPAKIQIKLSKQQNYLNCDFKFP